jgi:hypothetical protein
MEEGVRKLCQASFKRALDPFMRAKPFQRANHFPKTPPLPVPSTWGSGFQHMHFGSVQTLKPEHLHDFIREDSQLLYVCYGVMRIEYRYKIILIV